MSKELVYQLSIDLQWLGDDDCLLRYFSAELG